MRRQAIVHVQIPDEHFAAEPTKRCRDMRGIRRLRDPSFLIANGDNPCRVLQVIYATLPDNESFFLSSEYQGTQILRYLDVCTIRRHLPKALFIPLFSHRDSDTYISRY